MNVKYLNLYFYAGFIMNRFSKDLGAVDEILPDIFLDTLQVIQFFLTLFYLKLKKVIYFKI